MLISFSIVLISVVCGAAATAAGFFWAWKWFGDIWHANAVSRQVFIPFALILAAELGGLSLSPKFIGGLKLCWWHYLLAVAGFLAGAVLPIIYIRST